MWALGYSSSYAASCADLSGGMVLFWSSSVSISLKAFNNRCIDVHVMPENGDVWRATFVYGEPKKSFVELSGIFSVLYGLHGKVPGSAAVTSMECFVMMSTKAPVSVQTRRLRISSSAWLIVDSWTWDFLVLSLPGPIVKAQIRTSKLI